MNLRKRKHKVHKVKVVSDIGLFNMLKELANLRILGIKFDNTDFSAPGGQEKFRQHHDNYVAALDRYMQATQDTRTVIIHSR